MPNFVFLNKNTTINLDLVCDVSFGEHSVIVRFSNGDNLTFVGKEMELLKKILSLKSYNKINL